MPALLNAWRSAAAKAALLAGRSFQTLTGSAAEPRLTSRPFPSGPVHSISTTRTAFAPKSKATLVPALCELALLDNLSSVIRLVSRMLGTNWTNRFLNSLG